MIISNINMPPAREKISFILRRYLVWVKFFGEYVHKYQPAQQSFKYLNSASL